MRQLHQKKASRSRIFSPARSSPPHREPPSHRKLPRRLVQRITRFHLLFRAAQKLLSAARTANLIHHRPAMNIITCPSARLPLALCALITGALLSPLAVGQTAPTTSLPTSTSAANSAKMDEAVTLSVFTVSEDKDLGYESMQTTSGMRTAQQLKNVANSISIMNSQFIEDLGLTTMEEMSTWMVSGESNPDPNALVQSRVILRGVPNAYALRNGWIWYSPMDAFSTEKVEELRGPNAFLYGEADVGGANNQITKRGLLSRELTRAKIMAGSNNLFRAEVDFNRRLIRDKLAVRLSAVNSHNDSWIDNVRRDFRGIYSAITYRPTQQTLITVMAEHDRTAAVLSQGMMIDAFSPPHQRHARRRRLSLQHRPRHRLPRSRPRDQHGRWYRGCRSRPRSQTHADQRPQCHLQQCDHFRHP